MKDRGSPVHRTIIDSVAKALPVSFRVGEVVHLLGGQAMLYSVQNKAHQFNVFHHISSDVSNKVTKVIFMKPLAFREPKAHVLEACWVFRVRFKRSDFALFELQEETRVL
jgi:hypothetical protein